MTTQTRPSRVETIANALRALVAPGDVFEILALGCRSGNRRPHQRGGFFDSDHIQKAAETAITLTSPRGFIAEGVYLTLNPLNPAILARRVNRVEEMGLSEAASDADVIGRRWLLIDCDPNRISGVSSTEDEKQKSRSTASTIKAELSAAGWPDPIFADSGNGSHLLYRIDLPADDGGLVRNCLRALAAKHDSSDVTVDQKVFNPARICKLYGTVSRKGDHTTDRPHRDAIMIPFDGPREIVSKELLERLAATAPTEAATTYNRPAGGTLGARIRKYLAEIDGAVSGQNGHGATYRVACHLVRGFNQSKTSAFPFFAEWNKRCQPEWTEAELWHKLDEAETKAEGEPGYLLQAKRAPSWVSYAANELDPLPTGESDTVPFHVPENASTEGEAGASEPDEPDEIGTEQFPTARAARPDLPATQLESDDDPDRLARVFLEPYIANGLYTLRFWRNQWYLWTKATGCYCRIEQNGFTSLLWRVLKNEFDRIAAEALANANPDKPPPKTIKVGDTLLKNVTSAIKARTFLEETTNAPCWVTGSPQANANRDPRDFVAMRNGIFDVRAWLAGRDCLSPLTPQWFSVSRLPFDYNAKARSSLWDSFLMTNFQNDDERDMLAEWFGYCLTPDMSQQKFLMLEGDGGNGKSVVCAALEAVLGAKNVSHVTLENFNGRFSLNQTLGKLANIVAEVGELEKANEAVLKSFVSGDVMTFDRKNQSLVDAPPTARLVFSTNNRPGFTDRSKGIWRRMLLLPMVIAVSEEQKIQNMDKTWFWEPHASTIFNWALNGLARLRSVGKFTEPATCVAAIKDYRAEMNPEIRFLEDHFEASDSRDDWVQAVEVYDYYVKWCKGQHMKHWLGSTNFGRQVHRHFGVKNIQKRTSDGTKIRVYAGMKKLGDILLPGDF
jgi:P4 family phage/plasmid primase-like protien